MRSRHLLAAAICLPIAGGPALAGCPAPRTPGDVAALLADGAIATQGADVLLPLAGRRQGVAASLLELRYSIGKNATPGDETAERRIAELRGRIADREAELERLDEEIGHSLAAWCVGPEG